MNYREESLKKHYEWKGKIESAYRVPVSTKEELCLAYTPGVAEPCMAIHNDVNKSYELTRRWNTVPVITDGTAVLGLGDIGPEAGMPVMEGKCALFKAFANVDAFPICIKSKNVEEIIQTIKLISGSFGGINLEDISAPRCFEIETRLKEELDIPVFHDDQHGTAIVVGAALMNALKLANKKIDEIKVVLNGAGAAGIAICKYLLALGVKDVVAVDRFGIIVEGDDRFNDAQKELAKVTNREKISGTLADAMKGRDVFIGVSVANVVTKDMVRSMNEKAILFPLANPVPEISYEDAKEAGAFIVGTGSSEKPNQINNVLVFPGLFRGALDVRASTVNREMMIAASKGIMNCVSDEELNPEYILPYAWDERAHASVAKHVSEAAVATKVNKIKVD
jgi:malate dehydrogenase (oxaloacetate-decarboxylating)